MIVNKNGFDPDEGFFKLGQNVMDVLEKAGCVITEGGFATNNFVKFKFYTKDSSALSELEFGRNRERVGITFIKIVPNKTGLWSQILTKIFEFAIGNGLKVRAVTVGDESKIIWKKLGFTEIPGTMDMDFDPSLNQEIVEKIAHKGFTLELDSFFSKLRERRDNPLGDLKSKIEDRLKLKIFPRSKRKNPFE